MTCPESDEEPIKNKIYLSSVTDCNLTCRVLMYNEVTAQGDSSVIAKMPSPENNFLMFIVHV